MVCLGSNSGPQDSRRRRNHGAMAATQQNCLVVICRVSVKQWDTTNKTQFGIYVRVGIYAGIEHWAAQSAFDRLIFI